MIQEKLYARPISRDVNPAVSATDFQADTVKTEIDEYVFTDETINGLYKVLTAIREGNVSHNGIWVNGYFGSGKSHFMKYLGYCLNKEYQDLALSRLHEAVQANDPFSNEPKFTIETTVADSLDLQHWLKNNEIEIVMLNLGSAHNINAEQSTVFTSILWNQFNARRGLNSFNLALAQYLEKPLQEKGKFEEFKQRLSEEGFHWEQDAAELANTELDFVLDTYKEIVPSVTIEAVKAAIIENKVNISPANFCRELSQYIESKGKNYRLVFMLDEVSLFIDNRKWLLLQLQEIVTGLHNACADKVWLLCTAQQALNEVVDNVNGTKNDFGQIMGRFEVRVSLKGAQTEYITQQRLLKKSEAGKGELKALYDQKKSALESQFILPASYSAYADQHTFVDFYPFVPYQFRLIMQVFDSFVEHSYVDVQVKGNERSILKVTHTTAKNASKEEVGKLISFDRFYNAMFEDALTNMGQHAIKNANEMIKTYTDGDPVFGRRVVHLLFMICNLSQSDQLLFPATLDNILTLMLEDVDAQKATLREEVNKVLTFLYTKHILRVEKVQGLEVYQFQSEDEIEAAQIVENKQVDNSDMAEQVRDVMTKVLGPISNQESYCTRSFKVCLSIYGRMFLQANNPDITIDVVMDAPNDNVQEYALSNDPTHMLLFLAPLLKQNRKLRSDFIWYCKVQKFMQDPANSAEREKTRHLFADNARTKYEKEIIPAFCKMLNECEIASGMNVIPSASLSGKLGKVRYKEAVQIHLSNIYTYAQQVMGDTIPKSTDELKKKILRPVNPGEYSDINPLTVAEQSVDMLLHSKSGMTAIVLADIVRDLGRKPYGWSEWASIYVINELVRRNLWSLKYMNQSTNPQVIAANVMNDSNKFTIVPAAQVSSEVINAFIIAWNDVFNGASHIVSTFDINQMLRECRDNEESYLRKFERQYTLEYGEIKHYPFAAPLHEAIEVFRALLAEKETVPFLQKFIDGKDPNKVLLDTCKRILDFKSQQLSKYEDILRFIHDNQDNFDFFGAVDDRKSIEQLKAIESDTMPMDSMPTYLKLYKMLSAKVEELKALKRNQVKQAYRVVFEQLRQIESQLQLDQSILPQEEQMLSVKTQSNNLYALERAADTSDFVDEWERKIYAAMPADAPVVAKPSVRVLKVGSLVTKKPIKSVADIDEYLGDIRAKLINSLQESGENGQVEIRN